MVITRLFRDPHDAVRVLKLLHERGFSNAEVGTLIFNKGEGKELLGKSNFSPVDPFLASGHLAAALAKASSETLAGELARVLEAAPEKVEYYKFVLPLGGVLVSVNTNEAHAPKARQVLKEAQSVPPPAPAVESSPGFLVASRMSATSPVDAPMSGDFRRY